MNDDPLFPEAELRAHLARPPHPGTAPTEAWITATCARAASARLRRDRRAARRALLLALLSLAALAFGVAFAWTRLAPHLQAVSATLSTLADVGWSLARHTPELLFDGARQLSLLHLALVLAGLLALEIAALALLRPRPLRQHS